jgi:predicted small lipoprotein YifL
MRLLLLCALVALTLTGCGRRGAPSPPGPASAITYPHSYPAE